VTWCPPFQSNAGNTPFAPDPGAPFGHSGTDLSTTTRIGEYFGVAVSDGTAYVAWTGSFRPPAHPVPTFQITFFDSFPIRRGALTVTRTVGNDTIVVRSAAGNPNVVEVLVNGTREYAGLWSGLTSITVNGDPPGPLGGDDTIRIENSVAGVPMTVQAGAGNDTVLVGAGNLGNIQ